jgi:hypothetical protein
MMVGDILIKLEGNLSLKDIGKKPLDRYILFEGRAVKLIRGFRNL